MKLTDKQKEVLIMLQQKKAIIYHELKNYTLSLNGLSLKGLANLEKRRDGHFWVITEAGEQISLFNK